MDQWDRLWGIGSGLCCYDPNGTPTDDSDDSWTSFSTGEGLYSIFGRTEAVDPSSNYVWVGYLDTGVDLLDHGGTIFDRTDDTWVHFDSQDGLSDSGVLTITVEPGVGVWFGHFYGVDFLDLRGTPANKVDDVWVRFSTGDGLVFPFVTKIVIDSAGRKWFGTYDGVSCLDTGASPLFKGDDRWASFPVKAKKGYFNVVRSLAADQTDGIWVGTEMTGICHIDHGGTPFDPSDDVYWNSRKRNGLPDNYITGIAIDSNNGKWVGTRFGLAYLP